jgi:hypothetical protein
MYEIKDLQKPIMGCNKAVFMGERFMYPVFPGFESSAADTVRMSNKMVISAQIRAGAIKNV